MTAGDQSAAAALWGELRSYLASREAALMDELHHYPGPIARCDEQLPKLIEQRSAVRGELAEMDSVDAGANVAPSRLAFLHRFVRSAALSEDAGEAALRAKAAAALRTSDDFA